MCFFLSLLHHPSRSARFHVCAIPKPTVRTLVFDAPGTRKLPVYSVGEERLGTDKASLSFLKARGMQSVREDFHRPSGNNKMILQKQNDVIHHVGTEMFVVFSNNNNNNNKASLAKYKFKTCLSEIRQKCKVHSGTSQNWERDPLC